MYNTYDLGDKVQLRGTFTHEGEIADPITVRVLYKGPSGSVVTKTYPTDPEIIKESEGVYSIEILPGVPGIWHYRMDDGLDNVAEEGRFQVKVSNLL